MSRHAILIDGAFFIKQFQYFHKQFPNEKDISAMCEAIAKHRYIKNSELLRIYFYHAPPLTGTIENPFSEEEFYFNDYEYRHQSNLISNLKRVHFLELRLGSLIVNGWNLSRKVKEELQLGKKEELTPHDFVPNVQQKGVDMRIGLDVSRLTISRSVDKIVLVTADTDFVPCIEAARQEGCQVFLCNIGHKVHDKLTEHSDAVLHEIKV